MGGEYNRGVHVESTETWSNGLHKGDIGDNDRNDNGDKENEINTDIGRNIIKVWS